MTTDIIVIEEVIILVFVTKTTDILVIEEVILALVSTMTTSFLVLVSYQFNLELSNNTDYSSNCINNSPC